MVWYRRNRAVEKMGTEKWEIRKKIQKPNLKRMKARHVLSAADFELTSTDI